MQQLRYFATKRIPSIKFGRKSHIPSNVAIQVSPKSAQAAAKSPPQISNELLKKYARIPVTEQEIVVINSGGAETLDSKKK